MEVPHHFEFPFEPYQIQKDFMVELYSSLKNSKLAIFESPTGTGKSLSICCGALKWLKDHEEFERLALLKKIEDLKISSQTNDSGNEDWLTEEYDRIKKTTEINYLKKKLELITKQTERINNLQLRKSTSKDSRSERRKLNIENVLKSKQDLDLISLKQENILNIDSFTQNGDEFAIDDKDLLLDEIDQDIEDDFDVDSVMIEELQNDSVKIFFCSRTHSQLSQFVNEIKRTSFADMRVVSLASRQQYCINKSVMKLKTSALINERCLDLQKNKKGKATLNADDGKTVKKSKCASGCPYFNQANIEILRDEALIEIKDVEDLVETAKEIQSCPYYSARAAIQYAQVVVLPYQTVLHEATRRANGINLKNNVLIIDEAHNLLDSIGHIHSADVYGYQLRTALDKLKQYRDKYKTRFLAKNLLQLNQVIFIVGKILGVLKISSKPGATKVKKENKIFTIEEFVLHSEIDNYNIRPLLKFCTRTKLSQKLHGFSEKYPFQELKTSKDESKNKGLETFLSKMSGDLKKSEATEVVKTEETVKPEKYISVGNAIQSVLNFLEMLTNKYTDGRISTIITESVDEGCHKFMLLNPAAQFADIVKDARAVIVAGGTMQPFSEFRDQLFLSAGASQDRIVEFSCDHVIPPDNILPICLSAGPSGKKLNFSYEMRNTTEMFNEFGRILQNICNIVPGGVVCFFPSYDYEKNVYNHLESNGTLQKINTKKKVFREPKTTGQVDRVLEEYSKVIKKCKDTNLTGALMLSVIGGKLSEGLNFSDDLGRCIIVIGMPYPNINSVELKEKMKYLNENISVTAGSAHYDNLCLKAVNQCIGRAVRHANDYASVILLDERYSRCHVWNSLPKWIQRSLVLNANFGPTFGLISKFFSKHKTKAL